MWDEDYMNNESAGGGFYEANKMDSPTSTKKDDALKKLQSITPICIGMINENPNDELTIWGNPVNILHIVCIVRSFEVTSTTITYQIEDHTGNMKALLWLEHDDATEADIPVDKENIYVKVYGTLRSKGDEKVLMILKIAPISTIDEITCHLLEMISARVLSEKKFQETSMEIQANNPGAQLSNSMMSFTGGSTMEEAGMTQIQRNVYRFMKSVKAVQGISRQKIIENFPTNQKKLVEDAIAFLISEGHIFSTVDHEHFQITQI